MIKRPGRIRNWIIIVETGFIIGLLGMVISAKDYVEDMALLKNTVIQQEAEIERLKSQDMNKTCMAWWFGAKDLIKARDRLCSKKVKK